MSHIWLRHEYKSNERRAPITPEQVGFLVESGHKVTVETSSSRVFGDEAYKNQGAELATPGSWHNAPESAFILGIKEELQEEINAKNLALKHRHIYFAHVFKGQNRTPETMRRFTLGKGSLLDLEYLVDEHGKRVAAFSYSAGFAGAIAAVYIWAEKKLGKNPPYILPNHYISRAELIDEIKSKLAQVESVPNALVIGAKGRSGHGAVNLLEILGSKITKWGRNETKAGGPFPEILEYDIMCNCVCLTEPVAPFLTSDTLARAGGSSRLSVVADISNELSCNPIFGISHSTKFSDATIRVGGIDVIEIENLPALTPWDSSIEYANQLFPHLLDLLKGKISKNSIWENALLTYFQHHDIPQLAIECGRELGEMYLSERHRFDVANIRDYFSQIFAKNLLSRTDRIYFADYLLAGAAEFLDKPEQKMFSALLAKAEIDAIYESPVMRKHHALLKAVYHFSHSLTFECVKTVEARDDFYTMCDGLADIIDQKSGAPEKFTTAKSALLKKLGLRMNNINIRKFLDSIESSVATPQSSVQP